MTDHVEILEFHVPNGDSHLYLPDLQLGLPLPEAQVRLTTLFSQFGLLYQVVVKEGGVGLYAYVKFYSAQAARRALAGLAGKCLDGHRPCKLLKSRTKGTLPPTPLPRFKCEELANFYLGFRQEIPRTVLYNCKN